MNKNEFINELLSELSYRSDEGYPILTKSTHITLISEILDDWDMSGIKNILIENLIEAGEQTLDPKEKEKAKQMGLVWKGKGWGKEEDDFVSYNVEKGKLVKVNKDAEGAVEKKPTTYDASTSDGLSYIKSLGKDDEAYKAAVKAGHITADGNDVEITDSKPKTNSDLDRSGFGEKDKKQLDNPKGPTRKEINDDLNEGNLDKLTEYQKGVQLNREKGLAGMGGAVASEGESKYCDATNTDFEKWDSDNEDRINIVQNEISQKTKKSADEFRVADALGLSPNSDELNNYLAKRQVWVNEQLENIKKDKTNVFYLKGKKGFNGKDEAYEEWMRVAYDGAQTTKRAIDDSSIDASKPNVTIQSTAEVDQSVQAHLEDSVQNAKTDDDKKHAEIQLKNFNKFKSYHDTYVVGKDVNGRTTYMGISNKKDGQMNDPQNNTTPKKRFEQLAKKYGKDVAGTVTQSLKNNVKAVSDVKGNTVKSSSKLIIDSEYVAICETKEMKSYLQKLRDTGSFRDYVKAKGMNPDTIGTKELLTEMNQHANELIEAGKNPGYDAYGKIAIKVGEFAQQPKFQKENPLLNFENESIKKAVDIKENEKNVVKTSHLTVVNELVDADKPDGYSDENPNADNGVHQQGYISGVLDACHIDTYIDMDSDDGMLLQMGINGVKPSMLRKCVAEKSGFEGDSTTPDGKQQLKDHLRKRCRVTPGGDRITIKGSDGKDTELFEDSWRTAGTSQKVATHFGKSMRTCLQKKAAKS
jgi:hypothetical protein